MEGFIYLGEHYDVLGRFLNNTDKKIGLTEQLLNREYQLNRTKSPIGYKIIVAYKVDDMNKVEKMLHSILDSRRIYGEWFGDESDTLIGEFINFMNNYGAEYVDINLIKSQTKEESPNDNRLIDLANTYGKDTVLVRRYLGNDYEVVLTTKGLLLFNGEYFDTPNKLYNNGIVKYATGKKGNSGTNQMSQFIVKETKERLIG